MTLTEIALRLAAAVAAGAAIGMERQLRDKAAGLRTHILVALGAAVYLVMSTDAAAAAGNMGGQVLDPLRVIGGLIGGIGFLAAGVIMEQRGNVHGLTTAASLWMAAALGAGAGLGQFPLVGIAVALTLLVLWPIQYFERRLLDADKRRKKKGRGGYTADNASSSESDAAPERNAGEK